MARHKQTPPPGTTASPVLPFVTAPTDPWMKFYPHDWQTDPKLRLCSLSARGLLIELLCVMHEAGGRLLVDGQVPSDRQIARLVGGELKTVRRLMGVLLSAKILLKDAQNVIHSPRQMRDFQARIIHQNNGRLGAKKSNALSRFPQQNHQNGQNSPQPLPQPSPQPLSANGLDSEIRDQRSEIRDRVRAESARTLPHAREDDDTPVPQIEPGASAPLAVDGGDTTPPLPVYGPPLFANRKDHDRCVSGTFEACARGLCVPPYLAHQWRRQIDPEDAARAKTTAYLQTVVRGGLATLPFTGVAVGNVNTFWNGVWAAAHPTPVAKPAVVWDPDAGRKTREELDRKRRGPVE